MLKRTITYPDFDGNMITEDFWFHLSKAEIVEFEASSKDGMTKILKKAMVNEDQSVIIPITKDIILRSVGEKSLDGKRFIKNQEIRDAFYQTEAYSQLFMELMTDPTAAQAFVMGIMPANLRPSLEEASTQLMANA